MEASVDGYAQMCVRLSQVELDQLKKVSDELPTIRGKIWRYGMGVEQHQLPMLVYLRRPGRGNCAFSLPKEAPWEEKRMYVLGLEALSVEAVRNKKSVGMGVECALRSVYICRSDVF